MWKVEFKYKGDHYFPLDLSQVLSNSQTLFHVIGSTDRLVLYLNKPRFC